MLMRSHKPIHGVGRLAWTRPARMLKNLHCSGSCRYIRAGPRARAVESVVSRTEAAVMQGREIFRTQRENFSVAGRESHVAPRLNTASRPNQACSVLLSRGATGDDQISVGHRFRTVRRCKGVFHIRRKPWPQ
jgi:hypothetical protein